MGILYIAEKNASKVVALPAEVQAEKHDMTLRDDQADQMGGAWLIMGVAKRKNILMENNFENGIPKSRTLSHPGKLSIAGAVQIKYQIVLLFRNIVHASLETYLSGNDHLSCSTVNCSRNKIKRFCLFFKDFTV